MTGKKLKKIIVLMGLGLSILSLNVSAMEGKNDLNSEKNKISISELNKKTIEKIIDNEENILKFGKDENVTDESYASADDSSEQNPIIKIFNNNFMNNPSNSEMTMNNLNNINWKTNVENNNLNNMNMMMSLNNFISSPYNGEMAMNNLNNINWKTNVENNNLNNMNMMMSLNNFISSPYNGEMTMNNLNNINWKTNVENNNLNNMNMMMSFNNFMNNPSNSEMAMNNLNNINWKTNVENNNLNNMNMMMSFNSVNNNNFNKIELDRKLKKDEKIKEENKKILVQTGLVSDADFNEAIINSDVNKIKEITKISLNKLFAENSGNKRLNNDREYEEFVDGLLLISYFKFDIKINEKGECVVYVIDPEGIRKKVNELNKKLVKNSEQDGKMMLHAVKYSNMYRLFKQFVSGLQDYINDFYRDIKKNK